MEVAHTSFKRSFADCVNGNDPGSLLKRRLSSQSGVPNNNNNWAAASHPTGIPEIRSKPESVPIHQKFDEADNTIASGNLLSGPVAKASPRSGVKRSRPSTSSNNIDLGSTCKKGEPKPKRSRGSGSSSGSKADGPPLQVKSACTRCQHRKARCSGTRPSCKYCTEHELECSYDVAEGSTRTSDLKRKLRESSKKAHYLGCVLAALRDGTDFQASQILARLRLGDSLPDLLRLLPVYSSSPESRPDQAGPDRRTTLP